MAVAFSFSVGTHERHEVTVRVRGVRNRVTIAVDGKPVVDSGGHLGIVMPNVFDFEVGERETHIVSVRLIAQQIIDGGASYIDVFVDGRYAFRQPW
ncbi:hypothetical protein ACFSWE_01530 [Leucobacter albus]|uniref:Uncharacterized protein n=1 Tax=Leucobacter albus TaxID=272210 RepID=A0ABW3TP79_9MICO